MVCTMKKLLQRPVMLFIIITLGILLAVIMVKNKAPLQHTGAVLPSKNVEVITASKVPFRASVTAYGNVEPSISLTGMAEVSGKISYIHPLLKQGNSIPAGTAVVRIDPEDYQVTLTQTQADLAADQSSLKQLKEEEKTVRHSLALAKRNLKVGEQELARIQGVFEKKLVARSALDTEEQKVLQLQQQVEELQGQLNTFESRKTSVNAKITRAEQQVKGQQTTLGRTEIKIPFDARIGKVSVETGEFVSVGTPLFEALDVDGVEINAQLPVLHMQALVSHLDGVTLNGNASRNIQDVLQSFSLTANVRLVGGQPGAQWPARVLRISESIDPTRRTLGIVVGVDRPYEKIIPGIRPPLLKGMYTAVEIYGPERNALVIPRKAVHQGRLYIADKEKRLAIKPVNVQFQQGPLAIVTDGISEGEQIIINDIIPVIEGMPLEPTHATEYENEILTLAIGAATLNNREGDE